MSPPKRLLAGLLGLTLLTPAAAAPAAPAANTPELGRLFFTPESRVMLERQRSATLRQAQTPQGGSISLDGVVYRSGGKSTVWINRQAQTEDESSRSGVSVHVSPGAPGSARLVPGAEELARLKVGESVNRVTGERTGPPASRVAITPAATAAGR